MFCGLCEPICKLKYSGNTTNLFKHLQLCYPHVYSGIEKSSQASQDKAKSLASGSSSVPSKNITECFIAHEKYKSDSPRAKELTKAVGYFIVKDLIPTSVVQGDGFHKLLEKLDPRYQLPSRKTLSDRVIPTMYNNIKDTKVLPDLSDAKYVAITSDCWTSRVNQSYISVTTHFVKTKSDWKFERFVLESKELPGSHTAEHLAEAIKEYLQTHFRRSSKAMYILKEKQVALGLSNHSLLQDVETRYTG